MKKIIHFLFPRITIAITVVFFLLFFVYDGFKTAFDYTLLFFIMFMQRLDLIIAVIKGIKNWLLKNTNQIDNVYSLRKQSQHTDFQNPYVDKPTNSTAAPKNNNKELEYFASLCAASCEFDKTQNHIDETTHGNVRYNDKRFANVINDPEILSVVSQQKVKEYSEHIMKLCKSLGAEIQINGVTYTKTYVILKAIIQADTQFITLQRQTRDTISVIFITIAQEAIMSDQGKIIGQVKRYTRFETNFKTIYRVCSFIFTGGKR